MGRGAPLYRQIYETLRNQIQEGTYPPGSRFPQQHALSREFKVSLMTLRQALDLLERDGLIRRRHGIGTFVASPQIDYDLFQFRTFTGDLQARGEQVETRVLGARFISPDPRVAEALGKPGAEAVWLLERLRVVRGRPMVYQCSHLPAPIGREVERHDLEHLSLRHILRFKLGIEIKQARETIYAVKLGRSEAGYLSRRAGVPAFLSERISYVANDRPVVFDRATIPGDHFRLIREFHFKEA
jgi:GntR family transcriptional regulator